MALKHPGLYADLGKKPSDLLDKEFPTVNKLEWKGKTPLSGVNLELSATRNADGSVVGVLNPKYRFAAHGVALSATVDTNRVVKVEGSVEELLPGLKTTVTGHGNTDSITIDAEYKHEYLTLTGSVDLLAAKGNTIKTSGVIGFDGFALGLQAEYTTDKTWTQANGILSYSRPDFVASIYSKMRANKVGGSYYQRVNDRVSVGAQVEFDVAKTEDAGKLTVGGSYDYDPWTTVKTKFSTDGRVGFSYAARLNKNARLIIGSSFNANNLSSSGNHNFGFTLSLND